MRQQLGSLEMVPVVLQHLGLRIEDHACYVIHEGAYRRVITNDGPAPPRGGGLQGADCFETFDDLRALHHKYNPTIHYVNSMTLVIERKNGYFQIRQLGGPTWHWPETMQEAKRLMLQSHPRYQHGYVVDGDFHELETDEDWVMAALTL
jgi:hypothetical protein